MRAHSKYQLADPLTKPIDKACCDSFHQAVRQTGRGMCDARGRLNTTGPPPLVHLAAAVSVTIPIRIPMHTADKAGFEPAQLLEKDED